MHLFFTSICNNERTIMKLIFISIITLAFSIKAMQQTVQQERVAIVDQNAQESLETFMHLTHLVNVFGATPRYSSFVRFMEVLRMHLTKLDSLYKEKRRLKDVMHE